MKKSFSGIIEILLFFLAAISFFPFFYIALDMFSSAFVTGYRLIPAFFSYLLPTYYLFLFHRLCNAENEDSLERKSKTNGAVIIGISIYVITLDLVYLATGVFSDLVEGQLAPLFPLDTLMISLLSAGIGTYLYLGRASKHFLPLSHQKNKSIVSSLLRLFSAFVSLYMIGALIWGFAFANWDNPYFSCLMPFFIVMIATPLFLAYDLYFKSGDSAPERKKAIVLSAISLYALLGMISSLIVFCLIPNIIIIVAQPYFRFDAVCSLNLAPFLLILPPFFYSVYLWATFFLEKRVRSVNK